MKPDNQQQCTRCLMDTSGPKIHFDENRYCNNCINYFNTLKHLTYHGEKSNAELEKIVAKIKDSGKNHTYDCVIGVSGGIDSSYVAYLTKKNRIKATCRSHGQWLEQRISCEQH